MSSIDKTGVNQWLRLVDRAADADTADSGFGHFYMKNSELYFIDDAGTVTGPLGSASGGTGEIFVSATAMWPSTTSGCADPAKTEYTTNDVDLYSLDFDQTTEEYAQFMVWMPDDYDGGTVTFRASWTAASGTGDAIFGLQGRCYGNDDAIDAAWGTAVTVTDTLIATGDMHISSESTAITLAGTPVAGELVQFRVYRDADAGGDTLDADARLLGLKIYYTKS